MNKRTNKLLGLFYILIFVFTINSPLLSQADFEATLIFKNGVERIGVIKNFTANSKKIKFKSSEDSDITTFDSKEIEYIQFERDGDESGALLHYTRMERKHPKKNKSKTDAAIWYNVIYTCSDLIVLENFIKIKQKKKGLIFEYNATYPSDFILKKVDASKAYLVGLAINRHKAKGIVYPHKLNRSLFKQFFKDYPSIVEFADKEKKIKFDRAFEMVEMYCELNGAGN